MRPARRPLRDSKFSIREISEAAAQNDDIVRLDIGQPDFPTPQRVTERVQEYLANNSPGYTPLWGIAPLREQIADFEAHKTRGADDVLVTTGGTGALFCTLNTILSPGTNVITNDPAWPPYDMIIAATPGEQRQVPYFTDGDLDTDGVRDAIDADTVALIVNNPENPTGRVYTREELEQLAAIAAEYDIYLIADEVYDQLLYDGAEHVSLMELAPDRTIAVNSVSKNFAMTGWRLGWAVMQNAELREHVGKVNRATTACPNAVSQHAALYALEDCRDYAAEMAASYQQRRDAVMTRIDDLGWTAPEPDGALYVFPDTGRDSWTFTRELLDAGVAVVPGEPHGTDSDTSVRICFGSVDVAAINTAFDRIAETL